LDRLVEAGGGERAAVGAEGDAVDRRRVAGEGAGLLAGGEVPELDAVVEAAGGEELAVGTEGDTVDEGRVPLQFARRLGGQPAGGEQQEGKGEGAVSAHGGSSVRGTDTQAVGQNVQFRGWRCRRQEPSP